MIAHWSKILQLSCHSWCPRATHYSDLCGWSDSGSMIQQQVLFPCSIWGSVTSTSWLFSSTGLTLASFCFWSILLLSQCSQVSSRSVAFPWYLFPRLIFSIVLISSLLWGLGFFFYVQTFLKLKLNIYLYMNLLLFSPAYW